jgi:putative Mg2+ transporter-C (MgtC) family protein
MTVIDQFLLIDPFAWEGILSSMIAGAIIGFERQIQGKPIGIRTSILICMGTYIYIVVGKSVMTPTSDTSRVIGQVITGIGFLGAGVMIFRDGTVTGVTSAAAIWLLAAIGSTIGNGSYATGIKISILTVLVLVGLDALENCFKSLQKGVHKKYIIK